jgi:hypothetical protein
MFSSQFLRLSLNSMVQALARASGRWCSVCGRKKSHLSTGSLRETWGQTQAFINNLLLWELTAGDQYSLQGQCSQQPKDLPLNPTSCRLHTPTTTIAARGQTASKLVSMPFR